MVPEISGGESGWRVLALERGDDVGLREVVPLEKQRNAPALCEGIGKAVAEIQRGGMITFTKIEVGLARDIGMLVRDGLNANIGARDEGVEMSSGRAAHLAIDDDSRFKVVGGRHEAGRCARDCTGVRYGRQLRRTGSPARRTCR